MKKLIDQVVTLMTQKQKIEQELRQLKRSGEYQQVLHELVDRAPGLITIRWREVLKHHIFR